MTSSVASISEQADEVKAASAGRLPADVVAAFGRSLTSLIAAGVPSGAAAVGTPLSDAALIDAHGAPTSLHAVTAGRPSVLVFYRGVWCPYCNLTLRTYQLQLLPELTKRGVALVAISPQKPDGSLSMQEKHDLAYPVLSDAGNVLAGELGILMAPAGDEVLSAQKKLGLDVTEVNADGTETLPLPTVIVADSDHVIRWIDVHPDYTTRSEVPDILAAVEKTLSVAAG